MLSFGKMVQVSFYISEGLMILWVFLETTKSFPVDPLRQDEGGGEPASGYLNVGEGSYQPDLFKKTNQ